MAEGRIFTTDELEKFRKRIEELMKIAEVETEQATQINLGGAEKEYFNSISMMYHKLKEAALWARLGFEVLYNSKNFQK